MAKKKPASRDQDSNSAGLSFEEALTELEAIVADLEGGKLGLGDALARYEAGVKHLTSCQQLLERAERTIEILSGVDADGNPVARAFDDREIESLEEKSQARAGRRTSGPRAPSHQTASDSGDIDDLGRLF